MLKLQTIDATRHRVLLQKSILLWILSKNVFNRTRFRIVVFVGVDYALSVFADLIDKPKWEKVFRCASPPRTCKGVGHFDCLSEPYHTTTIRIFSIRRIGCIEVVALTRTAILFIPFRSLNERDLHTCHSIERLPVKGEKIGVITWT